MLQRVRMLRLVGPSGGRPRLYRDHEYDLAEDEARLLVGDGVAVFVNAEVSEIRTEVESPITSDDSPPIEQSRGSRRGR